MQVQQRLGQDVEPGVMTRAIEPALEPARQRVCSCAARLPVPAFVDLVVTSLPDEGRGSVEEGELDDELEGAREELTERDLDSEEAFHVDEVRCVDDDDLEEINRFRRARATTEP